MKLLIGSHCHFISDKQLLGTVEESLSYGSNCFMFYTGPNQSTYRSDIDSEMTKKGLELMKKNNIDTDNVVVHAPFILNFANNFDERKYNFYINFFKQEIQRCKELNINNLLFHPGSSVNLDKKTALENVANSINLFNDNSINLILEYMSGKGTEVCSSINEIKFVFDKVENTNNLFICIDTCHMNDSGVNISEFNSFLDEFDQKIGLSKLKFIHLNDSLNKIGTHKDRHANIGYGTVGFENLIKVAYNKRIENVPKILETPYIKEGKLKGLAPYKYEIDSIKNKKFVDFINN